jgi:translation initiation factor 1A
MPKNKGKGGKHHRRGKHDGDDKKAPIEFKKDGEAYAQVLKTLGNSRFELLCDDGVKRIGHVRGSMQRKVWITVGNLLLVALRNYQDAKCDIMHKYSAEDARTLQAYDELGQITTTMDTKDTEIVWGKDEAQPHDAKDGADNEENGTEDGGKSDDDSDA